MEGYAGVSILAEIRPETSEVLTWHRGGLRVGWNKSLMAWISNWLGKKKSRKAVLVRLVPIPPELF
jgi:hypothetical protein